MITILTFQDFLAAIDKPKFILKAIAEYKSSDAYNNALEAEKYFKGENTAINNRPKYKVSKTGKDVIFSKNIVASNFFFHFVVQQNQHLLANGLQLKDENVKKKLGFGFDKTLEAISEKTLVHGKGWGYWNNNHLEKFEATQFFALLDERTSEPMVGIRFWQIDPTKPMYIQLYEVDGLTEYTVKDAAKGENAGIEQQGVRNSYRKKIRVDGISSEVLNESNYGVLPVIPLYANEYGRSEFTPNIKSKIDSYDKIFSDFGDNLERTNEVYWVLSNFGGDKEDIKAMIADIEEIRATYSISDGTGSATATPHTIEVPYAARQTALELLEKALYKDYMAMNMDEIKGGSLTNVAIEVATTNLNMKVNRYEWQVFQFCQKVLKLVGIETEDIKFRRQSIANEKEKMDMLMACRDDLDLETALTKNPLVEIDEIKTIMGRKELENFSQANKQYPLDGEETDTDDGEG